MFCFSAFRFLLSAFRFLPGFCRGREHGQGVRTVFAVLYSYHFVPSPVVKRES